MIIFLHIPKTGGTTLRFILENNFWIFNCHTNQTKKTMFSQADLDFARKFFPGLRSISGHNIVDPLRFSAPSPFFMTFLREPVSRVISHYQAGVTRGNNQKNFAESLREKEYLNNWQVRLMAGEKNLDKAKRFLEKCSFVGLTEKFDLSLRVLGRLAPCQLNLHYKRLIVAKNNAVKTAVQNDAKMLELAREHNKLDLELYSFAVNEIFPRLCEKAGVDPSDKAPSYETYANQRMLKYQLGRFYNKIFRQVYKVRDRFSAP